MGTITGLTAARMLEIEGESIVDADIDVNGNLILTRHDGTTINTGHVTGAPGPVGDAGPPGAAFGELLNYSVAPVGVTGSVRAGHRLTLDDFVTLCQLPTVPVGLFGLADLTNLGSGGALVNKGAVTFGPGIAGSPGEAAYFSGSASQVLYITDVGAADPFRIRTGSWGCWSKTAKKGAYQALMARQGSAGLQFSLEIENTNYLRSLISFDGTSWGSNFSSGVDITDDRWHFVVVTFDGTRHCIYIDGAPSVSTTANGLLYPTSAAFNIGGELANATTNTTNPFFGQIDEAFITADVLSANQVRLLYAAKIPHGGSQAPKTVFVNVRRRRKGAALAVADFPAQPLRLYNLSDLTDLGSNNLPLTANAGSGSITQITGPDGAKATARYYSGPHAGDSASDTGLPAGGVARTFGAWFKIDATPGVNALIMGYGAVGSGDIYFFVDTNGQLRAGDGTTSTSAPTSGPTTVTDGMWHHAVAVVDALAADGLKKKMYFDGKLLGTDTSLLNTVLGGANRFRIGARGDGSSPFNGQIARGFVYNGAMTPDQIQKLYIKSAQDLGVSPKDPGEHIETFDVQNIYGVFDSVAEQNLVDLLVAT